MSAPAREANEPGEAIGAAPPDSPAGIE